MQWIERHAAEYEALVRAQLTELGYNSAAIPDNVLREFLADVESCSREAGPRGPWQRPSPGVGYLSPVRASALAISGPLPATPGSVSLLGPVAPPPLWQERAAQPADVVFQPVAPPGSESARSFVYGARLFRRLLQFW